MDESYNNISPNDVAFTADGKILVRNPNRDLQRDCLDRLFSVDEARTFARLLLEKADEAEAFLKNTGPILMGKH